MEINFENFVKYHESSLKANAVPERFWKKLYEKIIGQTFDAGEDFGLAENPEGDKGIPKNRKYKVVVRNEEGIDCEKHESIWLIDHCWTWRDRAEAARQLDEHENLKQRLEGLFEKEKLDKNEILDEIWSWGQVYNINIDGENAAFWYLLDEFGSRIRHHGDPNFAVVPFFCQFYGYSISIMFPRRSLDPYEEVTRDYSAGTRESDDRAIRLYHLVQSKIEASPAAPQKPAEFFEKIADKLNMTLPSLEAHMIPEIKPPAQNIKVYAETAQVQKHLNDELFELVPDRSSADILWLQKPIHDFQEQCDQAPHQIVNSFPFEYLMTVKVDLTEMAKRKRKNGETSVHWYSPTYDLLSEAANFIAEFKRRESQGFDNTWIMKSWNGQRADKTIVTSCLNEILRHRELNQPLVVQKFITNQFTINNRAFHYRYHFFIKSIQPIEAYVVDMVRGLFCPKDFDLEKLYDNGGLLSNDDTDGDYSERMFFEKDFVEILNELSPGKDLHSSVRAQSTKILRDVLISSISKDYNPPCVISHYPQSRGFYAADFVLEKTEDGSARPYLLEINFNPSLSAMLKVDPDFMNKVFKTMFCDDKSFLPLIALHA